MSLREFTVQGDGEASALVTTGVEMRGGAHQTRIRARPAYDTARAVGTRLMLYLVVCAWRTRSAPELGPAHSAHIGLAAHAFGRAVSIPLTHPLAFSLSPFLNARLPPPPQVWLVALLWLPPVNATSPSQGYTLLSRAILYSQVLLTLKGYPISRATQSQGLLTLKGATHSQGGYSLSRGPLVAPLPLGPLSVGLLSLALPPLALLPLTLLPIALLPIAVLPIALPPIALPPITLSTIALHSIDRRSLPPLSL